MESVPQFLMYSGILFQSLGAHAEKAWLPYLWLRVAGTASCHVSAEDRRVRTWLCSPSSSSKQAGANSCSARYVSSSILKTILCWTGSQCRWWKTGVMCSNFLVLVTMRAAIFCRHWSLLMSTSGRPKKRLLQLSSRDVTKACVSCSAIPVVAACVECVRLSGYSCSPSDTGSSHAPSCPWQNQRVRVPCIEGMKNRHDTWGRGTPIREPFVEKNIYTGGAKGDYWLRLAQQRSHSQPDGARKPSI